MSSLNNRLERLERVVKPGEESRANNDPWMFIDQRDFPTDEAFEVAVQVAVDNGNRVIQVMRPVGLDAQSE